MKKTILSAYFFIALKLIVAQSPSFLWPKNIGGVSYDYSYAIAVDFLGNVYTTGSFSGTVDFDPNAGIFNLTSDAFGYGNIFISKLDVNGNFVWAKSIGGVNNDIGNSIVTDELGNIYTTGSFNGTADFDPGIGVYNLNSDSFGNGDIFISKLDAFGNFQWAKNIGGKYYDVGNSIEIDKIGNVYTTGQFRDTVDFDPGPGIFDLNSTGVEIFISKLNPSGNFLWAKQIGGMTSYDIGNSIALDSSGNVYTTGSFNGTADFDPGSAVVNLTASSFGYNDVFISKLDSLGNFIWVKQMGEPLSDSGYSIVVGASGNIYATGIFLGTLDFDPGSGTYNLTSSGSTDVFILKLDSSGNFVWAKNMGGTNDDGGNAIAIDSLENLYTTGFFKEMADFDPSFGTYFLTTTMSGSLYNNNVFISKLDSLGNFLWAENIGGTLDAYGLCIAIDMLGNVNTTGYFNGISDFDSGAGVFNLTSMGNCDIFIHKMNQMLTNIIQIADENSIAIYPNPATNFVQIETELKNCYFSMFDIAGKLILRDEIVHNKTRIDLSNYSNGLYFIQLQSDDKMISKKFIKQ